MRDPSPWAALGAALATARHRRAVSQHQLARHLGITQAAYSQFERGQIRPRPAVLAQLAIALGVDVSPLAPLAGYPLELVLARPAAQRAPPQPRARDRPVASQL